MTSICAVIGVSVAKDVRVFAGRMSLPVALAMFTASTVSARVLAPPVAQQSDTKKFYHPGDGVSLPRVVREVKPRYTAKAIREKIEGKVLIECIVATDGSVKDVQVIKSLDAKYGLDKAAVRAAQHWRFIPGMKDGKAVNVVVTIELTFTLADKPKSQ